MPLQPDREIHVLADRGPVVAADGDDGVAAEQAECTRDEHHGILRGACEPEQEKRAHVLDDLEPREPAARQRHVGDTAVLDVTAVGDPDIAPDRHRHRIFEERQHGAAQRVGFEHGVGIEGHHKGA